MTRAMIRTLLAKIHRLERLIRDHRRKVDAIRERLWKAGYPG